MQMQKGGTGILQYGDHRQRQGQNLILSDLPDLMQNSIRKMHVDVPLEMAKILLPDSQMSVLDFVEVVLPPVCEDTDQASYHVPSSEGGGQPWQSRCWRWKKTLVAFYSELGEWS